MNVFVLSPGRCGTTTFIRACQHISNYTAGHETKAGSLARQRFPYPENHIEADNRLTWLLGYLEKHYGDEAFYVYMTRDRDEMVESFVRRFDFKIGIMKAYSRGVLMNGQRDIVLRDIAIDYLETVDENLTAFLSSKSKRMCFALEHKCDDFQEFWARIQAQGDFNQALAEWDINHNASHQSTGVKKSFAHRLVARARAILERDHLKHS